MSSPATQPTTVLAAGEAKAVRWVHSCIGANIVTRISPCSSIAGTSNGQDGSASQTRLPVAARQARCVAVRPAPCTLERRPNTRKSTTPSRLRPEAVSVKTPGVAGMSIASTVMALLTQAARQFGDLLGPHRCCVDFEAEAGERVAHRIGDRSRRRHRAAFADHLD